MNIAVIGTGYVGLVTGVSLSEIGHQVTCIDVDQKKVAKMQQGISPIYEPGLSELMTKNINEQRLSFTTLHREGLKRADVIYIAVGTPENKDGSADLSYVARQRKTLPKMSKAMSLSLPKARFPLVRMT